jgi:arylsulfatase A-like enzyme
MVMFDSLNRRFLSPYGCDWIPTPNFTRLAGRTACFENAYVGSMPCMPARQEIHTGRYNFLHHDWRPLQPYDDSMPEILRGKGVTTHLISDHYHYWEDGGANYHPRYSSWEAVRGQEGDPWQCDLRPGIVPDLKISRTSRNDLVNRYHTPNEGDHPQPQTFARGLEFLNRNHACDNWFLHLETFDPHEPYRVPERFQNLLPDPYKGPLLDWPPYREVTESPEEIHHLRALNGALVAMCDYYLGTVLDAFDRYGLWKDTMLIVNTDHGFLLAEHGWWAKCCMPFYNEIAHTPMFLHDPRCPQAAGQRRKALVQTIDLAPTLLEYFGVERTPDMQGRPLKDVVASDRTIREAGLFGIFGGHVNVTDGRYVYMRAPATADNSPLAEYLLNPANATSRYTPEQLALVDRELAPPFPHTKGLPTMRIRLPQGWQGFQGAHRFGHLLFDLQNDPGQENPLKDEKVECQMIDLMRGLMRDTNAPAEQYERLGVEMP